MSIYNLPNCINEITTHSSNVRNDMKLHRAGVLYNCKWKVENGKLFRFFISPPLGEGVAQATGEGLFNGKLKQKFRSQECRKGFYRMGKCHAEFISASDI